MKALASDQSIPTTSVPGIPSFREDPERDITLVKNPALIKAGTTCSPSQPEWPKTAIVGTMLVLNVVYDETGPVLDFIIVLYMLSRRGKTE